ncbi:hypothetical protein [Acetohalobium arabaticum]|uniref:TOBE domain protein n=1 Tax=Acetohalobium arabaticum (strain ATCC 49924 / DSM 5501 / Z-7288) TaxID=574087 RepID=D9QUV8_ACEAZ|nr:hypothetical protein [Acetohalobium arabaticum]ADL12017.1 hypothetical protein Acear_0471 [Acetohalobium arabaticum DSM 5501]
MTSQVVPSEENWIEKIAILPEDIYISDTKPPGPNINRIKGKLTRVEEDSAYVNCIVKTDREIKIKVLPEVFNSMNLSINDQVWLVFNLRKIKVLNGS